MSASNLPIDHPAVRALRTEFENLQRCAESMAEQAVILEKRRVPALYWPSRMTQKSLDKLNAIHRAAYAQEIAKRMGQLDRVDEKLARICPAWPRHSVTELAALPPPPTQGERS